MFTAIKNIVDQDELPKIRRLLDNSEFSDGTATAGYRAKRVKANLQLDRTEETSKRLTEIIVKGLLDSRMFKEATFPKAINTPIFSRYLPGMEYGFHVDSAVMNEPDCLRTDLSVTIFLNNPDEYEGGELVIQTPYGDQSAKLSSGDAIVYDASLLHRVMPVTSGERLVAITWVQSFIRDSDKRIMLNELTHIQKSLHRHAPDDLGTDLSFKLYENLYRLWAET